MTNERYKLFDFTYLKEISEGDISFIQQMLDIFTEEVPLEIEKIKRLVTDKSWEEVGLAAHKLRSKIRIVGLKELYELSEEIEQQGRSGPSDEGEFVDMTVQFSASLEKAVDILEKEIKFDIKNIIL